MQEMYAPIAPTAGQRRIMERLFAHVPAAGARVQEFFTSNDKPTLFDSMERRRGQLEAAGFVFVGRRAVGRNQPCPCGSGRKFKRCCLPKAVEVLKAKA